MFAFSIPMVGALLAVVCHASPAPIKELAPRLAPATFYVEKSWNNDVLYQGLASVASKTSVALELGVKLPKAAVAADLKISVGEKFLSDSTITVAIGGLEAYFEVDLSASASVHEAIELVASEKLQIAVPGLLEVDVGAALALDLVIGATAAVDVHAGFHVKFPAGAFVEISLVTKKIVKVEIGNIIAKPLPIAVGAQVNLATAVELQVGLRLRAEVGVSSDVRLHGLDIGTGAVVAIWVSLFDYTAVIVSTGPCPLSIKEKFLLAIGIAVEVNVDLSHMVRLSLAPRLLITIASAAEVTVCLPGRRVPPLVSGGSAPTSSTSHRNTSTSTHTSTSTLTSTSTSTSTALSWAHYNSTISYGTGYVHTTTDGGAQGDKYVTSTIVTTATYTVTSCHASVIYCPASYTQVFVTSTVISKTTVCPASSTPDSIPTEWYYAVPDATDATTTITLTKCPAETRTLHLAPGTATPRPTVTVTDVLTVCDRCEHEATSYPASPLPYPTVTDYVYPTATGYPSWEKPAYPEEGQVAYPEEDEDEDPEQEEHDGPEEEEEEEEEHEYREGSQPAAYPAGQPAYLSKSTFPAATGAPVYPTGPNYPVVTAGAGHVGARLAVAVGVVAALL